MKTVLTFLALSLLPVDERRDAGNHTVHWDGTGSPVPSGVYFYRMEVGEYRAAKKLLLVR